MDLQATHDRQPAPRIHDEAELRRIARNLRKQVIRMVARNGRGYVQQGLGAADIFALLYFSELRLDTGDPDWADRDRMVLSMAHNSALFHATLAERGLIPDNALETYCRDGSSLEINCSERLGTLVEASCGSLGQGLSVAVGMAASAKRRGTGQRFYVVLGDGELQEGQVWEAAMAAAHLRLDNLCLIIDYNAMQVEGSSSKVMDMEPAAAKWRAFGWQVCDIDGNDIAALKASFDLARGCSGQPTCIVARTLVGKGVSELEGIFSHTLKMPQDTAARALAELEEQAA
ncbi:Putative uncharacterized transketolase family protein y4mO [Hyphomicrobiales bacterium]|nr:Putative uncharacterized transketolase family protein y4mO [Hyphomicrobiales bacterium]CAH1693507.1 putative uncharacterized transketolase family protein y4mO [Hyphomicrobiales bacterium]